MVVEKGCCVGLCRCLHGSRFYGLGRLASFRTVLRTDFGVSVHLDSLRFSLASPDNSVLSYGKDVTELWKRCAP